MLLGVDALHLVLEAFIQPGALPPDGITAELMINEALEVSTQAADASLALLEGIDDTPPISGFDDEIDALNIMALCETPDNETDYHSTYVCVSVTHVFVMLQDFTLISSGQVIEQHGTIGKIPKDNIMIRPMIHFVNQHLWYGFEGTLDRLYVLNNKEMDTMVLFGLVLMFCTILSCVIYGAHGLMVYFRSVTLYRTGLSLLHRLPPSAFASQKQLLDFVLGRVSQKDRAEMSVAQSTIHLAADAIVCTGQSGVVEIVNDAVTTVVGYSPDQLLGQNVKLLFIFPDAEKVETQMTLMQQGQSSRTFEMSVTCVTDADEQLMCHLTLLGMSGSTGGIGSFVFIMRDESELAQQHAEAEAAKAKSEQLLFQILPRGIVIRLNQGERDVSFSVPQASIIFVDIVKFSQYAAMLSPSDIMGSLSSLFASFDKVAKNFNLLTKIKLIGDIYMAATGLFASEDENPNEHAVQIVKFGLGCICELEDVNQKLGANLQVRVGANSGGPVLAGVLGTDKPVFDIIGDPINVAARLQTTDVPGKVQIPQSTYELVAHADFKIGQRGETFLKGKGERMTCLVSVLVEPDEGAVCDNCLPLTRPKRLQRFTRPGDGPYKA
jgi:PAS domain S-box-containing protein